MSILDVGEKLIPWFGVILSPIATNLVVDSIRRKTSKKEERSKRREESFGKCLTSIWAFAGEVSRLEDLKMQGLINPDFTRANDFEQVAEHTLSVEQATVGPELQEAGRKFVDHFAGVAESIAENIVTIDGWDDRAKLRQELYAALPRDLREIIAPGQK